MGINKIKSELSRRMRFCVFISLTIISAVAFNAWRVTAQDTGNGEQLGVVSSLNETVTVPGQPSWFRLPLIPCGDVASSVEQTQDLVHGLAAGRDEKTQVEVLEAYVESYHEVAVDPFD